MSKSCCCSALELCVKSSTSSSEVEGWVRIIRGICHIIEWEGWGDQGRKTRKSCKWVCSLTTVCTVKKYISSTFSYFLQFDCQGKGYLLPLFVFHVAKIFYSVSAKPDSAPLPVHAEAQSEETHCVKIVHEIWWKTVVFQQITHSVIAIADNRLNALGQTTLCALHRCCLGRLACPVWRLLPCHAPFHPGSIGVWHLLRWKPVSEKCHPDAASCIPEGTDCLVVGRPLHVQAIDLEGETSACLHQICGAGEIKGAEVRGEGAAYVPWK